MLAQVGDVLELRGVRDAPGQGVSVQFADVRREGLRKLPLVRGLGGARHVVDATAGLCRDAFILAMAGCEVTAIERAPRIAALVRDGLERARHDPRVDQEALKRLRLVEGDAIELLPTLPPPEVVVLDPMFPPKRKASALARKAMRLLRVEVGEDLDALRLLEVARGVATKRVLVKRSDDGEGIAGAPEAEVVFEGVRSRVEGFGVGVK